jgi:hypothetical protein
MNRPTAILVASALLPAVAPAQMEKREDELYARKQFLAAEPAVDSLAPDIVLTDLDGRLQALSSYRGRVVVLIKAGFT